MQRECERKRGNAKEMFAHLSRTAAGGAGNGPPAFPQSPAYSQSDWPRKRDFAASVAKWLSEKCSLSRENRGGRRRNTPAGAGICLRCAFLPPGAERSRESMQKTPFSTLPPAPRIPRQADSGDPETACLRNNLRSDKPRTGLVEGDGDG